jgi:hypothetical protein
MTQQLSPAAQAVRDAVLATYADNIPKDDSLWALERASTVAALRAAIAVTQQYQGNDCLSDEIWTCDADELLAIAAELEAQ